MAASRVVLSGLVVAGLSTPAALGAQEAKKVRTTEFTGDLGLVNTAGNSEVTSFNVGDKLAVQSQAKRRASGRYEYGLGKRLFLYALVAADRNRFAGIQRRFGEGPGLTYKLIMAPKDNLDLEGGVLAVQQRSTTHVDDNFAAGRAAAIYKHNFTDKAYLGQMIEFLPNPQSSEDYRINIQVTY